MASTATAEVTGLGIAQDKDGRGMDALTHRRIIEGDWEHPGIVYGLAVTANPGKGMSWHVPEGVAVFKNAENVDAAKYFVEWLFSSDDHLRQLAEIEQKNGIKVIKPSIEGIELSYDPTLLMTEDLSLFGSQRTEILDRFEPLMGDKAAAE